MNIILSAIAPVIVIIIYIYAQDKYEKEPKKLLFACFLMGAILSIIFTFFISYIMGYFFELPDRYSVFQNFIKAFIVVALVEEFSKYIFVRYYAQPKEAFNEPYDGIVYAVMVSMGFAATENILYVSTGGYEVAILRAFTAIPAHATFGILMGYYMGKAKFDPQNKKVLNLTGLFLAIFFHGAYDFFLFIDFIPGISIGAFVSLIVAIVLSRKAIKRHQNRSQFK